MDLLANVTPREDPLALFTHWLRHYRAEGVTTFHLFVNRYPDDEARWPGFAALLSAPDVHVVSSFEGVEDMSARVARFGDYARDALGRRPYVLVADSDELIRAPAWAAAQLVEHGWDFVRGTFVDRFAIDGRTPGIDAERPLGPQFPRCASFTYEALGGAFTKVPIARPGVRYRVGFHGLEDERALRRPDWTLPVHHFKWTEGLVRRVRERLARRYGGEKYLLECQELLERYVVDDDHLDLSRITTWIDFSI